MSFVTCCIMDPGTAAAAACMACCANASMQGLSNASISDRNDAGLGGTLLVKLPDLLPLLLPSCAGGATAPMQEPDPVMALGTTPTGQLVCERCNAMLATSAIACIGVFTPCDIDAGALKEGRCECATVSPINPRMALRAE